MKRPISRKEFLTSSTKTVVAASAGALAASVLPAMGGQSLKAGLPTTAASTWPWPYATLDREDVRKRAHKAYYEGGCCYGAFHALISALADTHGDPYTRVPTQMMYYGEGGAVGWGTLCGALNGAGAAIALVTDRTNARLIVGELFGWYTENPFPSTLSNDYAAAHVFPLNKYDKPLQQTVSGSPLCHVSVSNWCTGSGFNATSPERAERCARLTSDVAAHAVDMLNDFFAGRFRASFVTPDSVTGCMGCHTAVHPGNVQPSVKMDCQQCHKENFQHLY
jgi:hypothetical protein